jgi:hypothetical protein
MARTTMMPTTTLGSIDLYPSSHCSMQNEARRVARAHTEIRAPPLRDFDWKEMALQVRQVLSRHRPHRS